MKYSYLLITTNMKTIPNSDNELNFDFIISKNINSEYYYQILRKQDKNQLQSLYNYIYIHCSKLYNSGYIDKKPVKNKDFNECLKEYISQDNVRCLLILNLISKYFE